MIDYSAEPHGEPADQAGATPDGNVAITLLDELPGAPDGRQFGFATGDMPMPPGGLAYIIEIIGDPNDLPGAAEPSAPAPASPVAPTGVEASAPTAAGAPAGSPADTDEPSGLRIIGYVDRFSRAFAVDGALTMPPAQRADLQLLRYADRDDGAGCVELPGFDPDDEPWRVAEFRATPEGRVIFTDSRVDLGLAPGGPSLTLAHAVSLAFLAFVHLPQQRGEDILTLGVPDVLEHLRTEPLFDAIDHIVSAVDEVAAQLLVTPPGVLLYLARMLRAADAVGLTPAALAARPDPASGLAAGGELSWVSAGAVAPSPLLPGLFLAAAGPSEPQVHLVRTTEYANLFYVAFTRSQVSDEGARTLLEIEGILNRFLLITRRLDEVGAVMTATEAQCAELDRWVIEDILAQGLTALRDRDLLSPDPAVLAPEEPAPAGRPTSAEQPVPTETEAAPAERSASTEQLALAKSESTLAGQSALTGQQTPVENPSAAERSSSSVTRAALAGAPAVASASIEAGSPEQPTAAERPVSVSSDAVLSEPVATAVPAASAPVPAGHPATSPVSAPFAESLAAAERSAISVAPATSVAPDSPAGSALPDLPNLDLSDLPLFTAPAAPKPAPDRGDLDTRLAFARVCESLQLPYRLEYRFRYDAAQGALSVDIDRPSAAIMPRELWDRAASAWRPLSQPECNGDAARYAFHLATLVACAAFACDGRVRRIIVNVWGAPSDASAVLSPTLTPSEPPVALTPSEPDQPASAPVPSSAPAGLTGSESDQPTAVPTSSSISATPELGQPTTTSAPSSVSVASESDQSAPASAPSSAPAAPEASRLSASSASASDDVAPASGPNEPVCLLSVGFNRKTLLAALRSSEPAAALGFIAASQPVVAPGPQPVASSPLAPARSAAEADPSALIRRFAHAFRLGPNADLLPVSALVSLDATTALPPNARTDIETDERPFSAKAARLLRAQRVRDLGIYEDAPRRALADMARSAFAFDDLSDTLATIRDMYNRTENVPVREACLRVSEGVASGALTGDSYDELREIFSDVYGLKAGLQAATRLVQRDPMAAVAALESLELQVDERGWFADTPTRVYRYFDCYASRVLYATHCAASLDGGRDLRLCADENFLIHHRLASLLSDSIEHSEEAIRHGRRCVELAPSVAASYLRLARCYFCAFDYQSEINVLNRMLTIAWNPTDVGMALYWLGYAYWMTDRKRLGLACYQRSVLYDRSLAEPCTGEVSEFLRKEGMRPEVIDDEEARELFRESGVLLGQVRLNAEALVRAAGFAADAGSYRLAQNLLGSASVILRDDALAPVLESYGSDEG